MTRNKFRTPASVIHAMRCLQILTNGSNQMMRDYPLTGALNMAIGFSVGSSAGIIRTWKVLPNLVLSVLILSTFCAISCVKLVYWEFGNFHSCSQKLLKSWKHYCGLRIKDKSLLNKYLKSCRVLRVELSSFGYFRKGNGTRIIGKLVYYVNKILMLTENLNIS